MRGVERDRVLLVCVGINVTEDTIRSFCILRDTCVWCVSCYFAEISSSFPPQGSRITFYVDPYAVVEYFISYEKY